MRGRITGLAILIFAIALGLALFAIRGGRRSPGEVDLKAATPSASHPGADASIASSADEPNPDPLDATATADRESPGEEADALSLLEGERTAARRRSGGADLLVRVTDPMGRAQEGVPVELRLGRERFLNQPLRTDERGEVRLAGARKWIGPRSAVLHHDLPFARAPELRLDAAALEGEVVVSRLPPFGSILVSAVEPDGRPPAAGTQGGIGVIAEEERGDASAALERRIWARELEDGEGRINFVELGGEWEVRAWFAGSDVLSRAHATGPLTHGEEVRVVVKRGKDHPILSFRAVREDGSPIRNAELEVKRLGFPRPVSLECRTDEHGDFRVDVPLASLSGFEPIVVVYRTEKGPWLAGTADRPDSPEPGLHECGNLVLSPVELLVSGQVVDSKGQPVEGAQVVAGTNTLDGFTWNDRGSVAGRSGGSGRFELHGTLPVSPFGLRAGKGPDRSEELEVERGRTDVLLVLEERYQLSGTIRVPEGFDPDVVRFELLRRDDGEHEGLDSRSMEPNGSFTMTTVPAGVYALRFRLGGRILKELPRLVVHEDTDLGEVDLRGRLGLLRLELVGGEGAIRGELTWRKSGEAEEDWQQRSFAGREPVLSTLAGPLEVLVQPEGYRQVLLEGVQDFGRVELRPALQVRLELETNGPLPGLPYLFEPRLEADDHEVGTPVGPRSFTDENRAVFFNVAVPGELEVAWHLEKRGERWVVGGEVLLRHRVRIEVLDVPGIQTFTLSLEAEALSRLTEEPPF